MTRSRPDTNDSSRQARTILLAADHQRSILAEIAGDQTRVIAYSAYGQLSAQQAVTTGLGFNGELREARLGWYLLGNGYRAYNPILMRFHSPDSWSPFGKGGLNAYMYCVGDPVNASDPTGHMPKGLWKLIKSKIPARSSSQASLISSKPESNSIVANIPTGSNTPTTTRHTSLRKNSTSTTHHLQPRQGERKLSSQTDPSTGESIYEPLPLGRRTWIPPSESPPREGMMSYAELAEVQRSEPSTSSTLPPASVTGADGSGHYPSMSDYKGTERPPQAMNNVIRRN